MTSEPSSLCLWLGSRLKCENAYTTRIYFSMCRLERVEGLWEKVPKTKHTTASELRVGWNANHERAFGLLDRTMVHVDQSKT